MLVVAPVASGAAITFQQAASFILCHHLLYSPRMAAYVVNYGKDPWLDFSFWSVFGEF